MAFDWIDEQLGRCSHRLVMVLDRYRGLDVRGIKLMCDEATRIGTNPESFFETGKVGQMQPELLVALAAQRDRNGIADRFEPATQEIQAMLCTDRADRDLHAIRRRRRSIEREAVLRMIGSLPMRESERWFRHIKDGDGFFGKFDQTSSSS